MSKHPVSTLALFLLLTSLLTTACSRKKYIYAQTVTDAGQGRFWLAGSEGFAAFFDGSKYTRCDYPRHPGAPDWAYQHSSSMPVARVVINENRVLLFSHVGDVLHWSKGKWERIRIDLNPQKPFHQLNTVLPTPDGKLLIQLHATTLLWTTYSDLLAGRVYREETPSFLPWLGFFDEHLIALGWAPGGNQNAIVIRQGPNDWPMLATIPAEKTLHIHSIVGFKDGSLATIELGAMRKTPEPALHAKLSQETKFPLFALAQPDAWVAETVSKKLGHIAGSANVRNRGAWLFGGNGVAELGKTNHAYWQCPPSDGTGGSIAIGAIPVTGGVRLVTKNAAVWDLIDGKCSQATKSIL